MIIFFTKTGLIRVNVLKGSAMLQLPNYYATTIMPPFLTVADTQTKQVNKSINLNRK